MSNKMLIDAAHPEETRVVVLRGNRVEDFDFESASKKPLRGNIYLAKVTRVEPSLQAAFIEYGGNRHGFLAFSEIHPDYYQIPVADRQALLEDEARAHREEDDESRPNTQQRRTRRHRRSGSAEKRAPRSDDTISEAAEVTQDGSPGATQPDGHDEPVGEDREFLADGDEAVASAGAGEPLLPFAASAEAEEVPEEVLERDRDEPSDETLPFEASAAEHETPASDASSAAIDDHDGAGSEDRGYVEDAGAEARETREDQDDHAGEDGDSDEETVEQLGGDALEDVPYRAPRARRHYKIQEVIKRRQILLVQVVKEERGNKGAALTTYLSLAGRYSVLMPNTARGGGISRKITDSEDRKRLKSIAHELEVPEGMGIILRTAGAARSESEVKRDFEYLLRMWETIRELTLRSSAPTLVYEEGSLIKRAIRDLYSKEMDEVCVAGEVAYREAKEFMRLLMPTHAKHVRLYADSQPIFAKSGVEAQLDAMFSNHVTLRSGGYIVINQTEALVAIDVNSGRSTREHNIEDTALRTNLEAADEVARQLRLRDLAGLIVVDFIDMEEGRNNRAVERRIKDALKNDRARIQIGHISHFGLLEMSRQRIRTGVLEGSTVLCPHCAGAGSVRSTSSIALHVLRVLEDTLIRSAEFNPIVRTKMEVALYILNQKRAHLSDLEQRFGVMIMVLADPSLTGTVYHALERGEAATPPAPIAARLTSPATEVEDEAEVDIEDEEDDAEGADETETNETTRQADGRRGETDEAGNERRRRRRRRRRGRDRDERTPLVSADGEQPSDEGVGDLARMRGEFPAPDGSELPDEPLPELSEASDLDGAAPADDIGNEPTAPSLAAAVAEPEAEAMVTEAPRRRRTRRSATRSPAVAEDGVQSPAVETVAEDLPATPRRSRRSRVRAPEEDTPSLLSFAAPSADRDVGAPIARTEPDEVPPPAAASEPAPAVAEAPPEMPADVQTKAEPVAPTPSPAAPAVPDPDRPKRSGWWQRAKATLTGE